MNFFSKLYYRLRKSWKAVQLYLVIAGPGLVVMIFAQATARHID